MNKNTVLVVLLALGTAGLPYGSANAQAHSETVVSGQLVTHLQLHRGTADFDHARQWVQESVKRAGRRVGLASNLSADALGDVLYVEIVHHTRSTGLSAMSGPPLPEPPWTPGSSGYSIGDTATVSTTSGRWTQTWSLELAIGMGGNLMWVTTAYSATKGSVGPGG